MPAQEAASTYADDESEQPAEESKEWKAKRMKKVKVLWAREG